MIDVAVGAVHSITQSPRRCLQMSVLVERLLADVLPHDGFALRLGSLRIDPVDTGKDGIVFDPRGPDGVDGGFHAWVEDRRGELVDPSISLTLADEGYDVDPETVIQCRGRAFPAFGLAFRYEAIEELELVGLAESAVWMAAVLEFARTGRLRQGGVLLDCALDVQLRVRSP